MAVGAAARAKIAADTKLQLVCRIKLTEADNVFSDDCPHFTRDEKQALLGVLSQG